MRPEVKKCVCVHLCLPACAHCGSLHDGQITSLYLQCVSLSRAMVAYCGHLSSSYSRRASGRTPVVPHVDG